QRLADDEEGPSPSGDIAEAVRRLAERTRESINPTPEIPLPLGATVSPPEPPAQPKAQPKAAQPQTEDEAADASRVMAERVARILQRTDGPKVQQAAPQREEVRE